MSKTIIFTATLPYEAYKSYKREVDYELDSCYSGDDLYALPDIIEENDEVWAYLMKEAYSNADTWDERSYKSRISETVIQHINNAIDQRDVKSIRAEVDHRTAQLTITFKDDIDTLDEDVVTELLKILASDVFQYTCNEHLTYFSIEDYNDRDIYDCEVMLKLKDSVSANDLEYTIEYK